MPTKEPIRIGLVGCGAIAELYHLPALAKVGRFAGGVALAEPNQERRQRLAAQFGASHEVDDYRQLAGCVDGVIVATPPATHYEISKWFLQQGIHVLCEKPLTESAEEAAELVRIAADNGVQLAVNQTRRFFPSYQKIRELIAAGALGDLCEITYHDGIEFDWPAASPHHFRPDARGAWSDTGVHLLDTVCFWINDKLEVVESLNDARGGPEALATVRLRHQECEIELKVSRLGRLRNGFTIRGTQGQIQADAEEFGEVRIQFNNGRKRKYRASKRDWQYTDFAEPLLENFADVIAGQAVPHVSGQGVLQTVSLLEAAYQRAECYSMPWDEPWRLAASPCTSRAQRVLVTGASGFLGGRLMETLGQTESADVVGTIRSWCRAARPARQAAQLVLCDIEDPVQVDRVLSEGFDTVIHTAYTDTRNSIVGGTQNLLTAAERHGVERLVFLSSAEVYGPDATGVVREDAPTPSTGRLYGDAKVEAEELCREFAKGRLATTILRPSIIYGPFSSSWTIDIAKRLQSGNWGTFDKLGEGRANLIYVDDLVRAIVACVYAEAAANQTFNVNGPEPPTWNEYFALFNAALGRPELATISESRSRIRTLVMDSVGYLSDRVLDRFEDRLMEIYLRGGTASRLMKRIKGRLDSTPSGSELHDLFTRSALYDAEKIRSAVGFEPAFSLEHGLQLSSAWLALHEKAEVPPARADISAVEDPLAFLRDAEVVAP